MYKYRDRYTDKSIRSTVADESTVQKLLVIDAHHSRHAFTYQ